MVISIYDKDLTLFKRAKRVTVDGKDVTDAAFFADDERGIVLQYSRDPATNAFFIDPKTGAAAVELVKGRVEILLNA